VRYDERRPTLYREIGGRIMLARRRAGLSQRELGARLGITHAAVSYIERAKSKPNLDNLADIAEAIGVSLGEIVILERERRSAAQRGEGQG